jgi:transcriptional regulator of arginine metabolism
MKQKRQLRIAQIIRDNCVETQEDLARLLREAGFDVTQATVSRDIREMNLLKISDEDGKQKYAVINNLETSQGKLVWLFKSDVVSIDTAGNIVVLKTTPGMAQAVAARIDALTRRGLLGSVAGDDTIICVLRAESDARELVTDFRGITECDLRRRP